MPNKNYISGRRAEYKLRNILREGGYNVLRTAGSHGDFDLIAVIPDEPVRLIQVKAGKGLTPKVIAQRLREFSETPPLEASVGALDQCYTQELWVYSSGEWHSTVVG